MVTNRTIKALAFVIGFAAMPALGQVGPVGKVQPPGQNPEATNCAFFQVQGAWVGIPDNSFQANRYLTVTAAKAAGAILEVGAIPSNGMCGSFPIVSTMQIN